MVSVNTKSGPMDQIGKITSILSINNGKNILLTQSLTSLVVSIFSVDHPSISSAGKLHLFGNSDNVAAAVAAYGASLNSNTTSGGSGSIHGNTPNTDVTRGLTGNNVNGTGHNHLNNSGTNSNNATAESIMELSTKMLQAQQQQYNSTQNSQGSLSTTGSSTSSMFPPKSQIKRQKMIYHCKVNKL